MKQLVLLIASFLLGNSLLASPKDDLLLRLASEYSATFESAQFQESPQSWANVIGDIKKMADKNTDKDLSKGYTSLSSANKILLNAFNILSKQCISIDKFKQVEKDATSARTALKSASFVMPGKRDTRELLVKLSDFLVKAAKIGDDRAQICSGLETVAKVKELRPLLEQMEQVRVDAKAKAKAVEDEVKATVDPAVKALEVEKLYVEKRKKTLKELKAKQALKIEEITKANDELLKLEENIGNAYSTLVQVPEWMRITIYVALSVGGLTDAENKAADLQAKIAKNSKDLVNISVGMDKIDAILAKEVTDPHFERDRKKAQDAAQVAARDIAGLKALVEAKTKEALAAHNVQADSLIKDYEARAKNLHCKSARTIGGGLRALDQCKDNAIQKIKDAAPGAKLTKQCSLTKTSDASAIDVCQTAIGK